MYYYLSPPLWLERNNPYRIYQKHCSSGCTCFVYSPSLLHKCSGEWLWAVGFQFEEILLFSIKIGPQLGVQMILYVVLVPITQDVPEKRTCWSKVHFVSIITSSSPTKVTWKCLDNTGVCIEKFTDNFGITSRYKSQFLTDSKQTSNPPQPQFETTAQVETIQTLW